MPCSPANHNGRLFLYSEEAAFGWVGGFFLEGGEAGEGGRVGGLIAWRGLGRTDGKKSTDFRCPKVGTSEYMLWYLIKFCIITEL